MSGTDPEGFLGRDMHFAEELWPQLIRVRLTELNWSSNDLAVATGVQVGAVRAWLNGRSMPCFKNLTNISQALQVTERRALSAWQESPYTDEEFLLDVQAVWPASREHAIISGPELSAILRREYGDKWHSLTPDHRGGQRIAARFAAFGIAVRSRDSKGGYSRRDVFATPLATSAPPELPDSYAREFARHDASCNGCRICQRRRKNELRPPEGRIKSGMRPLRRKNVQEVLNQLRQAASLLDSACPALQIKLVGLTIAQDDLQEIMTALDSIRSCAEHIQRRVTHEWKPT